MKETLTLDVTVSYWDVDRDQQVLLAAVFKFLQEAAIKHADQLEAGARAMVTRGESWVLNRLAAQISRYPHYEERLRVETWSTGIRTFRGYRDFRVLCGEELVVSASSLWLYVNARTKSLVRVPGQIAAAFPSGPGAVFRPDLDQLKLIPPDPASATRWPVSVRYSDLDGNGHVNNTAYFDYLQTALIRSRFPPRPAKVEIQFLKEIPPEVDAVEVQLAARGSAIAFGITGPGILFAQGQVL
ncbi:MAG TPA: acyl-ACP thioesterase domain-containing protein [Opitutaceae bacterium]|nr:acyl-ACP thioesterase domain-containing protein [Opitutaceae bacterium]